MAIRPRARMDSLGGVRRVVDMNAWVMGLRASVGTERSWDDAWISESSGVMLVVRITSLSLSVSRWHSLMFPELRDSLSRGSMEYKCCSYTEASEKVSG